MSSRAKLVTGSVGQHLVRQTAPMVLGIASVMSVGVLDAYFVGNIGPDALAAISFIFPVTVALQSLGVGVMVGINSVVARALGGEDGPRAERRAVQGFLLSALLGFLIAGALYAVRLRLFVLLNAEAELLPLIDAYMTPYALGFPLVLVATGSNGVLRGQGLAVKSSMILLSVSVTNWILDPILIAGVGPIPSFGIAGAAYATNVSFFVALVVGVTFVQRSGVPLKPSRLADGDWAQGLRELARVGGPAAFANAVNPTGLTILTGILATHGKTFVAAYGAAGRAQSLAIVPLLALSSSVGPIVGQNWGAMKPDRARRAHGLATTFSIVYGVVIAGLMVLAREPLGRAFTDEPAVVAAVGTYLWVAAWGVAGFGVLVVTNAALNAVDKAPVALGVSMIRVLLVMLPVAWFAGRSLGAAGVFGGELAANLVGGALAFGVGRRALRSQRTHMPAPETPAAQ